MTRPQAPSFFRRNANLLALLRDFRKNADGGIALIFAIAVIPVLFASGMAVDYGLAFRAEVKVQDALDNALIAGAREANAGSRETRATDYFNGNIGELANYAARILVDTSGTDSLDGTATARVPSVFAGLMGVDGIDIIARASVSIAATVGGPCITLVSKTAYESFRVNSGADVTAPTCEVHVHSTASRAANFNAGINLEFQRICIAGTDTTNNYGKIDGLELGCTPSPDPYANKLPVPPASGCDHSNLNYNGGTATLQPGVYCGWTNFNNNPKITFQPGVYVIKNGGWNVNGGNWSGDGVTFFFADQSMIQFNSGVKAKLTPPTSGTYKGLMFYEPDGLSQSNFVLDDSKDFEISGIIHLPSRNTIYNAGSQIRTRSLAMVFNTLILNQTKWTLSNPDSSGTSSGNTVVRLTR